MTPAELLADDLDLSVERLFERGLTLDENDCWLSKPTNQGYVRISVRGKDRQAHRLMYEYFRAPIPTGLTIDHLCRVRNCLNPWHMEPVTSGENVLRGEGLAPRLSRRTHCNYGHEFTPENTVYVNNRGRRNQRRCRECVRLNWYRRQK